MKRTIPQVVFESKAAQKVIKEGTRQAIAELDRMPAHKLDEGNPNNPLYNNTLFGYDEREFMAKQHK